MPQLDFTSAEAKWYAREEQLAKEAVEAAIAAGRLNISNCLTEIFATHGVEAPANVQPFTGKGGKTIGVRWGKPDAVPETMKDAAAAAAAPVPEVKPEPKAAGPTVRMASKKKE